MQSRLKVLHVYRTYFPDSQGGLEEVIRQICGGTTALGVENRIFTLSKNPHPAIIERSEATVYRFRESLNIASCGMSISAFSGYSELVAWADIVHFHFPWPFADLLHMFSRHRKPSLVTYHSDIVRQERLLELYRPLKRAFLGSMDAIVPTSDNYFATSTVLGENSEKVKVIPIGLNEASYPVVTDEFVRQLETGFGSGFFLFIGMLRYYKGLHILMEALKDAPVQCIIVGTGPTENELREHAERLQLDNVRFLGRVNDETKVALLKLCKAVVFPSHLRSEAFGVTLLEGAMYGKPLISTEIGTGTSFVNLQGETGLVVLPSDVKSLRDAMLNLDANPDQCKSFGENARQRFEMLFTAELMCRRYLDLYREMLWGTKRARVVVLLAAYEGMQFYAEQIDSILDQLGVEVHLIISLDKSTDSSYEYLSQLETERDEVTLLQYGERYGSAAKNFFRLFREVDFSGYDFVALADQDDIWNADKLARAVKTMQQKEIDCYSSNALAFWEDGRQLLTNKAQPQAGFDYLFEAAGPGCSYVVKRQVAEAFQRLLLENQVINEFVLHDWLIYAFARSSGFAWYIDPRPGLLYRQHASNVVGVNNSVAAMKSRGRFLVFEGGLSQVQMMIRLFGISKVNLDGRWNILKSSLRFWGFRRKLVEKFYLLLALLYIAVFGDTDGWSRDQDS